MSWNSMFEFENLITTKYQKLIFCLFAKTYLQFKPDGNNINLLEFVFVLLKLKKNISSNKNISILSFPFPTLLFEWTYQFFN